jgi:hypothetical protein
LSVSSRRAKHTPSAPWPHSLCPEEEKANPKVPNLRQHRSCREAQSPLSSRDEVGRVCGVEGAASLFFFFLCFRFLFLFCFLAGLSRPALLVLLMLLMRHHARGAGHGQRSGGVVVAGFGAGRRVIKRVQQRRSLRPSSSAMGSESLFKTSRNLREGWSRRGSAR